MEDFKALMRPLLLFIFAISSTAAIELKDFKIRAREHFEWHKVDSRSSSIDFRGLSNTFNIWYEKPYDYSIGLALSPLISKIETDDSSSIYGKKINLFNAGIEAKYFPKILLEKLFTRTGLGYTIFNPDIGASLTGVNLYLGLGYEIPFKNFGLALEVAYRKAFLEQNTEVSVITPSIGFHFYEMF